MMADNQVKISDMFQHKLEKQFSSLFLFSNVVRFMKANTFLTLKGRCVIRKNGLEKVQKSLENFMT